jgi:hypothetical protein
MLLFSLSFSLFADALDEDEIRTLYSPDRPTKRLIVQYK